MTIWINQKHPQGRGLKSISILFRPQHWRLVQWKDNGAKKGRSGDRCYDLNIYFLGIFFSYTNWDYNPQV